MNQISLDSIDKKIDFEVESIFLNFNYTLTLEEVYKIPCENILHIHGDIEKNYDSLIFGHNEELIEMPEIDENGYSTRTIISDSENVSKSPFYAFQKPVKEIISENLNFFESLKGIEEIIILGHSLNSIDIPYFQEIVNQTNNNIEWKVSFYEENEKKTHLSKLQEIGIKESNIELFNMNKRI